MSWSQSRLRKWHRDNPGRSRFGVAVARTFRRNRHKIAANIMRSNSLLKRLMARQ